MARRAEARRAATPSSPEQRARRRRILNAATDLAVARDFDQLSMTEVARAAKVALATLYRYFPSKTQLFVAILRHQIKVLARDLPTVAPGQTGAGAAADLLVEAQRRLLEHPRFAMTLVSATNAARGEVFAEVVRLDEAFGDLILQAARVSTPTPADRQAVRLLVWCWFGVLTMTVNGLLSAGAGESDIRRATGLLLADLG
ncbi:MAG TPA: TetR family transcriptional regulator [Phycicoccus sp.]|nr:TetR family transcriptional regulator [Phycicoccus sp.]